jgi:hypothetical protein
MQAKKGAAALASFAFKQYAETEGGGLVWTSS